jgi:hypothetical protein
MSGSICKRYNTSNGVIAIGRSCRHYGSLVWNDFIDERRPPMLESQGVVGDGYDKSRYDPDPLANPPRTCPILKLSSPSLNLLDPYPLQRAT